MATVESFERQGNQTTRVFTRTTYLTLASEGIEGGFLNSHSCSIIEFRTAIILSGRFATTCSGYVKLLCYT